jgi:site-specific recombinase XerD
MKIKKQLVKQINKYIRRIAETVGIEKDVTTYVARHSFATVLKRSGASIKFISEQVGHSSIKTTENYADSFEDDIRMHFAKALTNFKDNQGIQ